jgi:hypothetical protein
MERAARPAGTGDLPEVVEGALAEFLAAAKEALGPTLRSAVLYGSGAEGRLRATSDLNLILVLESFDPPRVDRLREPLRVAEAAAGAQVMFLRADEIPAAAAAFAPKFADVVRRHRVLHGPDPGAGLAVPRDAERARLRQESLNLVLRLRSAYASRSLREEQAALAIADAAGPLRGLAATLLGLEGAPAASPREALRAIAAEGGPSSAAAVEALSEAREHGLLPPGDAGPALLGAIAIAERLHARAGAVR